MAAQTLGPENQVQQLKTKAQTENTQKPKREIPQLSTQITI